MFTKKTIFLIFCTVFVAGAAFSQKITLSQPLLFALQPNAGKQKKGLPFAADTATVSLPVWGPSVQLTVVPASFSTSQWGFFCRQELKWEKISKVPFRFRLGSVQQCDRLEGKRVAVTQ
jgi:hypothetical protein